MFSDAESQGIVERNPISRTAKPKLVDSSPEIFSVDELRALLEAANRVAPDVLPMLAIGAFAGVREAEIQRLDWSEVDCVRGHIEAKSARRRIVPIQPNFAAWLQPYSGMTGAVVPVGAPSKLARVREAAKLARWPNSGFAAFVRVRIGWRRFTTRHVSQWSLVTLVRRCSALIASLCDQKKLSAIGTSHRIKRLKLYTLWTRVQPFLFSSICWPLLRKKMRVADFRV